MFFIITFFLFFIIIRLLRVSLNVLHPLFQVSSKLEYRRGSNLYHNIRNTVDSVSVYRQAKKTLLFAQTEKPNRKPTVP